MGITHYIYMSSPVTRFYIDEAKLRGMYGNTDLVASYGNARWINFNFVMVF